MVVLAGALMTVPAGAYLRETAEVRQDIGYLVASALLMVLVALRFAAVARDQQVVEREVRAREGRYRALVEKGSDAIGLLDRDVRFTYVTPAIEGAVGRTGEEVLGRRFDHFVHPEDAMLAERRLQEALDEPGTPVRMEVRVGGPEEWRWTEVTVGNRLDDPNLEALVVTLHDVSERKQAESLLAHRAMHDPLTGLPNRNLLIDRLGHALARTDRHPAGVAVLFCDLDRFKTINDSLGHDAGDRLLVLVAERLRRALRPADTVARFGGDEFIILCEDVQSEGDALSVGQRILEELAAPFDLGVGEVFASTSIGIAIASGHTDRAETLIQHADVAMFKAKDRGRNRFELYDDKLRARAVARLATDTALRKAIERGEFRLVYQPVVAIAERRVVGMEALIRWEHPERGLLGPAEFVNFAEEMGLIVPIGTWALTEACSQLETWQAAAGRPIQMAVNLSARQLRERELPQIVERALVETGADPTSLCLEITESIIMDDAQASVATLSRLRAIGVHCAIDDFGTGYSSLAYLKQLPVDHIKIDRSFISGIGPDTDDSRVVAAIIGLARARSLVVVAEGVETAEQFDELERLGCDHAQGYFLARPGPPSVVGELLNTTLPSRRRRAPATARRGARRTQAGR
jgi:diguanylate cyclase (GGDEF)-like protein/PAS domain S-box-containing protein